MNSFADRTGRGQPYGYWTVLSGPPRPRTCGCLSGQSTRGKAIQQTSAQRDIARGQTTRTSNGQLAPVRLYGMALNGNRNRTDRPESADSLGAIKRDGAVMASRIRQG